MKSLETILNRYTQAVRNQDKAALLALYSGELRMFDMVAPFEMRGHDDLAHRLDQWFDGSVNDQDAVATNVESQIDDNLAVMTMLMDYSDIDGEGKRQSMVNRLTWVLVPDGEDWKIIHEHTSVPLKEDDMSPQFEP